MNFTNSIVFRNDKFLIERGVRFWPSNLSGTDATKRLGTAGGSPLRSLPGGPGVGLNPGRHLKPIVSEMRWLQTTFVLIGCLAPSESVVHADQGSGRGRFGAEGTTSRTGNRGDYSMIVRVEIHVVALQKRRPARREHPFNATAGRPT